MYNGEWFPEYTEKVRYLLDWVRTQWLEKKFSGQVRLSLPVSDILHAQEHFWGEFIFWVERKIIKTALYDPTKINDKEQDNSPRTVKDQEPLINENLPQTTQNLHPNWSLNHHLKHFFWWDVYY